MGSRTCKGTLKNCDDNNPCTTDQCVLGSCENTPDPSATCEDGDLCTINTCVLGECQTSSIECNDGNLCTEVDLCSEGTCSGVPITCNDGDVCTNDFCNAETGECETTPNSGAVCNDGNLCTTIDVCV